MFAELSDKLNKTFKKLKGHGILSEKNIQDALKDVRMALLEADVNYKVVKKFIEDLQQRVVGKEVHDSLTPGQQVIHIVNQELTALMGGVRQDLLLQGRSPFVILLIGLQGSGKTTTSAKLAVHLRKLGRNPYLVPADIYRPAAIDQLKKLGAQINIPVHPSDISLKPDDICLSALSKAGSVGADVLILDTAGRLHIDEDLMDELVRIKKKLNPHEILLVADSMTGQDAVNVAKQFDQLLDITGIILTKMEGDARGGAALSMKAVTNKPIKFIGMGEKLDALEPFFPDRMASRILGMGDVLSLIEKAQEDFDQKEALDLAKKLKKRKFDLEDFQKQLKYIKKLGSMEQILSMLPGIGQLNQLKKLKPDEKELVKIEAIINSMTMEEKADHKIINGSRRKRIAKGSGTKVEDVNKLLKNFMMTKKMMEQFAGGKGRMNMSSMFR
jgi:signal recognition particle subunit SRP54